MTPFNSERCKIACRSSCSTNLVCHFCVRENAVFFICLIAEDVGDRQPLVGEVVDYLINGIFEPFTRYSPLDDPFSKQAPKLGRHLRECNRQLRRSRFELRKRGRLILKDRHLATATLGELMQQQPPRRQLDGLLRYVTALSNQLRADVGVLSVLFVVHRL